MTLRAGCIIRETVKTKIRHIGGEIDGEDETICYFSFMYFEM